MQVALAMQAGKISSAMLLRPLGHENRQSHVYLAAHELGSVVRTRFLLDWISNAAMRQEVTATTNKVECGHGFAQWLSFGGEVIAENDPHEQQKQIRYNDLLASAVILQNAIDMARIVEDLRRQGWPSPTKSWRLAAPIGRPACSVSVNTGWIWTGPWRIDRRGSRTLAKPASRAA